MHKPKPRYQVTLALTKEDYENIQWLEKAKGEDVMGISIFREGLASLIEKAKRG